MQVLPCKTYGFASEILEDMTGAGDFAGCLRQRLALFARQQIGQLARCCGGDRAQASSACRAAAIAFLISSAVPLS
jgi:hypothetical protein